MRPTCRHCHARPISEARGLCRGCYGVLEIRNLYPTSTGCYCRRPLAHGNESLPLADAPTNVFTANSNLILNQLLSVAVHPASII